MRDINDLLDDLRDCDSLDSQLGLLLRQSVSADELEQMDVIAAAFRVGSDHQESPNGIESLCSRCGNVDSDNNRVIDLYWHPMSAFNFLAPGETGE
jgi:hypothetical protein